MSENPRDTQFAGFANLLFDELCSRSDMYIDSTHEHWEEEWKAVIARRAYDLVRHTLEFTEYEQPVDAVLPQVPDLTKWPKGNT